MGRSWETIEKKNLNHNNLDQEAIDFINSIIVEAQKSEEKAIEQVELILLQAINKSYIQLPKVVKIEVAIIVL